MADGAAAGVVGLRADPLDEAAESSSRHESETASARRSLRGGVRQTSSRGRAVARARGRVQPGTWVTGLSGDIGNTARAAATLGLARSLISAAPSRPPASQSLRLARLRDRAELLQLSWIDAGRPIETSDLRKLDTTLDRRWSALRSRLDACIQLGDDDHTPRAEALLTALFPTGLDFLKLPYALHAPRTMPRAAHEHSSSSSSALQAAGLASALPLLTGTAGRARWRRRGRHR
jgi:hypothetical protein